MSIAPPGRQQLSVKISDEACERFRHLARAHELTLGELFEQALDVWETHRPPRLGAARPDSGHDRTSQIGQKL